MSCIICVYVPRYSGDGAAVATLIIHDFSAFDFRFYATRAHATHTRHMVELQLYTKANV